VARVETWERMAGAKVGGKMLAMPRRDQDVSNAISWCALSVLWAAVVGAAAVVAGLTAGVIALVGFGADSITDGVASAALVWRFRRERSGEHDVELVERRAAGAVGTILIGIGIYVGASAVLALAGRSAPDSSPAGVALTSASILVLPVLARAKLRLATSLDSSALRGDGVLSLAGAALAAFTLASLALNAALGWWWSDAAAALLIAAFLLREGWRTASTVPARRARSREGLPMGWGHCRHATAAHRWAHLAGRPASSDSVSAAFAVELAAGTGGLFSLAGVALRTGLG
jgi:hypothetical protein